MKTVFHPPHIQHARRHTRDYLPSDIAYDEWKMSRLTKEELEQYFHYKYKMDCGCGFLAILFIIFAIWCFFKITRSIFKERN